MVTGFVVILMALGFLTYVIIFFSSLPSMDKMDFAQLKKVAVERTGKRFESKRNARNYQWEEMRNISRDLIYSVVHSEDGEFFEHQGVNYTAMIDSLAKNIRKREYASGASTITQQVAKNLFLRQEKSLVRKLKEIVVAKRLEKKFKKNQILEVYLNIVEFGPDIFGVGQAAKHFFNKAPNKINAVEGAFMGLMLPSPRRHYYSIFQNKYLSKNNRKKIFRVLQDLLNLELISPKQYRQYTHSSIFKIYVERQ